MRMLKMYRIWIQCKFRKPEWINKFFYWKLFCYLIQQKIIHQTFSTIKHFFLHLYSFSPASNCVNRKIV
jgi:hypothetical protein